MKLAPKQRKLLEALKAHPSYNQTQLGQVLNCSQSYVSRVLRRLTVLGVLNRSKHRPYYNFKTKLYYGEGG
jgi:DNA-binding MarR family transcriptional regulator